MPRERLCKQNGCRSLHPCAKHPTPRPPRRTTTRDPRPLDTLYSSREWKLLRTAILERDENTCHYCGITGPLPIPGGRLSAAHLDPTKKLLELGIDPLNPDRIVTAHTRCAERNAPGRPRKPPLEQMLRDGGVYDPHTPTRHPRELGDISGTQNHPPDRSPTTL